MDPIGANLSLHATRHHVLSARPDAPVVPHRTRRRRPGLLRRRAATLLRRAADRLAPAVSHEPATATATGRLCQNGAG